MTGATGGNHRHVDNLTDRFNQFDIEAITGTVAIHRIQQDLPHSEFFTSLRPPQRINAGATFSAVSGDFKATGLRVAAFRDAARVDGQDNTLGTETLRKFSNEFWTLDGSGVDANFIGTST